MEKPEIVEAAEIEVVAFAPEEIMATDEVMPMDLVIVDEPAPLAERGPIDYEKSQDLDGFMDWITKKMSNLPPHSGKTTAGCERVIAHLKMLDKEISKAISRDVDCKLDDQVVEKFRKDIRKMIKLLDKRHREINEAYDADDEKFASADAELVKAAAQWTCPECSKVIAPGDEEHKARHNAMEHGHEANDKMAHNINELTGKERDWAVEEQKESELYENLPLALLTNLLELMNAPELGSTARHALESLKEELAQIHAVRGSTLKHLMKALEMEGKSGLALEISDAMNDAAFYADDKLASLNKEALKPPYVRRRGDKWVVLDKHNGKVLSEHATEEKAKGSLAAMHMHGADDKKAHACSCNTKLATDDDNCPTCKIKLWKAAEGLYECISCDAVYERPLTKEAGTPKLTLVMTPFERAITGAIINGFVSQGKNPEDVYAHFKKKYKFTDRDELSIQQVLADMGYPMLKDRGHVGDDSEQLNKGKGIEFSTQYNA